MRMRNALILLLILLLVSFNLSANKLKILIVTGGHDFDRESFFQMFDSFNNLTYKEFIQPEARIQLGTVDLATFDAVVFYDMPKSITDQEKKSYYRLLKAGKGLLFLHHSICAYQDWPEFESIVGGKYYENKKDNIFGASSYQHDVEVNIQILKASHPVTKGLKQFTLHDEVYRNLEVLPVVLPLLSTDHPKSNTLIGWTLKKENSKIVFIQSGHDKNSFNNSNYRQLVKQAIGYIASK